MATWKRYTGVRGNVIIPSAAGGTNINFTRWTADILEEEHVVTGFNDAGNAEAIMGGLIDLKGNAEGFCDSAGVPSLGTMDDDNGEPTGLFYLEVDGTLNKNYKFTGILSGLSTAADKRGLAPASCSFESSGDILYNQIPGV